MWQYERYPILRPIETVAPTGRGRNVRSLRASMRQKGARRASGQAQGGFAPSGRGMAVPRVRKAV